MRSNTGKFLICSLLACNVQFMAVAEQNSPFSGSVEENEYESLQKENLNKIQKDVNSPVQKDIDLMNPEIKHWLYPQDPLEKDTNFMLDDILKNLPPNIR